MEQFLLYNNAAGELRVEVLLQEETLWLTQKAMGQLFGVESHTVTYHIKEIFSTGELEPEATTRKIRAVQQEGAVVESIKLNFSERSLANSSVVMHRK